MAAVDAALAKAVPLAVQAAVAEERGKAAVLEGQIAGMKEVLLMATKGQQGAETRERRLRDGIVWGCVGAAVITAGVYVFGVWTGITLGR